jgi:AraC-like DNA-binding protein
MLRESRCYWLRRQEGSVLQNGAHAFAEDFLVCRRSPPPEELRLVHCFAFGEGVWRKGYKQSVAIRGHWSFELLLEGDAVFESPRGRFELRPGDSWILRQGESISCRPGPSGFLRKSCVLMKSPLLDLLCGGGRLDGVDVVRGKDWRAVAAAHERIAKAAMKDSPQAEEDAGVACYALLSVLSRLAVPLRRPKALQEALALIERAPEARHSLAELASSCGVSPRTLSRLFSERMNCSPGSYVALRRLEQAKSLLLFGGMTLKEIAARCGYSSESFLSRSFKRAYGLSPRQLRSGGAS